MRKSLILLFLVLIILSGCVFNPAQIPDASNVFFLSDTLGNSTTTFQVGEEFYMNFRMINTTDSSLTYTLYDSGPEVRFSILRDSIYVAGSMDGYGVRLPVFNRELASGDSIVGQWKAPTTPAQDPIVTLEAGTYLAVPQFPAIPELQTETIMAISFTIVE